MTFNWKAVQNAWIAGDAIDEITRRFGVPRSSVYRRSKACNWPQRYSYVPPIPVNSIKASVAKTLEATVKEAVVEQLEVERPAISAAIKARLGNWLNGALNTAETLHKHIDSHLDVSHGGKVEVETLKSLSSTFETTDRVARRTFGLDSPDGRNLGALVSCASIVECPAVGMILDAQVVVEPASPIPGASHTPS